MAWKFFNSSGQEIVSDTVADNSVTLAKLEHGTQGDVLYYGASGAPTRLGFGTDGHFLKTQGTGANPLWAAAAGTTINTNADNRIITGSGTANTLNGESNLTFSTDLTITSGNLVMATSGKGIDFSATANSSGTMANEILDDYEEGTWTPELWDDGNDDASAGYDSQLGQYTKIGNIVHYSFRVHMNAITGLTAGNNATIGGLPFAPSSASFGGGGNATYMTLLNLSTDTNIMLMTEGTSPELAMYQSTAGNADGVLISEVSADGLIQATGHYMTAT